MSRIGRTVLGLAADGPTSTAARAVLLAVAVHANRDGIAWPSETELGRLLGLHPGNVRRHVLALERAGLLAVSRRPGRANVYRMPAVESPLQGLPEPGVAGRNPLHDAGCQCPRCHPRTMTG